MADENSKEIEDDQATILPGAIPKPGSDTGKPPSIAVPSIDNYEILDELGRGGMGVVYKARDTKLDRVVALKMILGGKFASDEEIQRFRIEGESAARLDHPGIVPIYDTGQVDGNHFFAMKFIGGSSLLDKLDEYQSDRRAGCELIAKIADAVQHAHQRAVLHRDLKPANVLIDSDGQPAITDFGLAKRTDGDSELTQTGLVMGTPGFMSPEQAAGRKDVTTSADIFSLGAMLYWIITGEPPFKGETGIQAVMKTIEGDTPSLRLLVPDANSDLDLICQKAMHRDPLQRYSSAAAMADDLRAWLDGEPLSVRRATAMNMASVWVRKNLRTVLAACATGLLCGLIVGGILGVAELRNAAEEEYRAQQLGGESSSTWVSIFIGLRQLSSQWFLLSYLMVPAVALCAFLCVRWVRPKTREANIAAAVTCGIVASAVTFLLGGGWGIVSSASVDRGFRDIELLSSVAWLESESERKLARRAFVQRYPGLEEMGAADRQLAIRRKIMHDQKTGLTPGIWMGVCVAILFTGLPLTLTSVLSGMLWRQGIRGWQWFGCTWERAAYLLLFFLVLSFLLRPVWPSIWLVVASLAMFLLGLFLAVRMSSWYLRVGMVPVPFICMALIGSDYQGMLHSVWNAGRAGDEVELRQQMENSDRLLAQTERSYDRYAAAIGWLYLGDEDRYQHHCDKLRSSFEFAYRPEIASRIAKVSLLRPDLQTEDNLDLAEELAEYASGFESSDLANQFRSTRALAELRRGNYKSALEWNQKCRALRADQKEYDYTVATSHAVDALAHVRLGETDLARASLELGRKAWQVARQDTMQDGVDERWPDWATFQVLEKEILKELQ
ncbi:serine/threonine-protein kinase [Mariniblastus fucicola]|uniref:non-specific serine/threonine protein kinase n=1 Tax=Mariniblastus fucicola TaxID=980251 RepID=A0A5B9PC31_9BACT|nr:serine/threonine-protein kinase [Mariniblastus fucicola]QEG24287.1 Serine/threonine-protein kinase PrkC [Mariniblastus fucicola]